MWDRVVLKENAKMALSGDKYWKAFAVCLINSLIVNMFSLSESFSTKGIDLLSPKSVFENVVSFHWYTIPAILLFIFIGLPLIVGVSRFFLANRFGQTDIGIMFTGFTDSYSSTITGMLTTALIVFLCSLALIIPGIVEGLKYTMVPFILADNPTMPGDRARQISSMMTNGEKGEIFVLYLSFFGWFLLAGIVLSLFSWLLWPIASLASIAASAMIFAYQKATFTELYIFMRDRIIRCGAVSPAEFGKIA